jgi:hypothetical protein
MKRRGWAFNKGCLLLIGGPGVLIRPTLYFVFLKEVTRLKSHSTQFFVKYETKVTMADIVIFKRAFYRI